MDIASTAPCKGEHETDPDSRTLTGGELWLGTTGGLLSLREAARRNIVCSKNVGSGLIAAIAEVKNGLGGVRLIIAGSGSGDCENRLLQKAKDCGVSDAVQFVGFVDDLHKQVLLGRATVFVLPSYQENFGLAAVEAMAAGLPVVVTRGVDLWQEVETGGAGLVVDADSRQLATALVLLLQDKVRCKQMGENGVRLVERRFSHRVVGKALMDMYRRAVEEYGARN